MEGHSLRLLAHMSHHTNNHLLGFTLLELLVSVGILGAIGVTLVGSLYSILTVRSKQQSVEVAGLNARGVLTTIASAIETASSSPVIASGVIKIKGSPCRSIARISGAIYQATDYSSNCSAPGTVTISDPQLTATGSMSITQFSVASASGLYTATISGTYKDGFGSHDFQYDTSVIPRIAL